MKGALDASALLALLLKEPGWERVFGAIFVDSPITTVNFAEVATRYALRGAAPDVVRNLRRRAPLVLVPVDEDLAVEAAVMAPLTKPAGLSLGDRLCLALAKREGLPALTADRKWKEVETAVGVEIEMIR